MSHAINGPTPNELEKKEKHSVMVKVTQILECYLKQT